MPGKLGHRCRRAVRRQVVGAGAEPAAGREQATGHQGGILRLADHDHDVDALLQRIDAARGQLDLGGDLRVLAHEVAQQAGEEHLAELYRRGDPQQSRRRLLQLHDRLLGLGEIVHDLPAALVVGLPYFGQAQLTGGAIEQAHAQALLQQGDAPAHRGLLHAQALRGLGEAVVLHHAGEDQRIIKPHYCSL